MSADSWLDEQDAVNKRSENNDQQINDQQIDDGNESVPALILEERKRLARDLHDSVNQKLFSLSLIARGLSHQLIDQDEKVKKGIREIGQLAQDALTDLRNLIWQLQPIDTEQDFLELLQTYGEQIGLHVSIECYGEEVDVSEKVVETMLRIGQEALNNVRKHSGTDQAYIRFHINHEQIQLEIADQGRGFKTGLTQKDYRSFGMTNMKERAAQVGGEVSICSTLGNGTNVIFVAPVKEGRVMEGNFKEGREANDD